METLLLMLADSDYLMGEVSILSLSVLLEVLCRSLMQMGIILRVIILISV